jgi:hypothetical protein
VEITSEMWICIRYKTQEADKNDIEKIKTVLDKGMSRWDVLTYI